MQARVCRHASVGGYLFSSALCSPRSYSSIDRQCNGGGRIVYHAKVTTSEYYCISFGSTLFYTPKPGIYLLLRILFLAIQSIFLPEGRFMFHDETFIFAIFPCHICRVHTNHQQTYQQSPPAHHRPMLLVDIPRPGNLLFSTLYCPFHRTDWNFKASIKFIILARTYSILARKGRPQVSLIPRTTDFILCAVE